MKTLINQTSLLSLLACLFLFPAGAFSQNITQTIRGTVRDMDTQSPITGAAVYIPALEKGAYTDEDGEFHIKEIPLGRHALFVSFLGYEARSFPNVVVTSGKEVVLTVDMTESVAETEEVVIVGGPKKGANANELSVVSTRAFSVDEGKRFAGSFDDPSRMASSFAGVSGGEDDSENEIVIRGNSPRFLLWRIEGIEVPSPNHFTDQGASSGAVSILSANMLANSDFSTGAFGAEYGNALSGVFDISLRKGNNEKREYAAQVGVLGADVALEGPFKKGGKASYLVNYRYSTLAILGGLGLELVGDAIPVFQDLSFKLHLPTQKYGTFSVFGIGGLSHIDDQGDWYRPDSSFGLVWKDRFDSDMGMAGINHHLLIGNKTVLKTSLAVTGQNVAYYEDEVDSTNVLRPSYEESFGTVTMRAKTELSHKINARHLVKAGAILSNDNYNLFSNDYDFEDKRWTEILRDSGNAMTAQAYANYRFRPTDRLTIVAGMHMMHFGLTSETSYEPRASIKYQLDEKSYVSAGFGVHSRRADLATFFAKNTDAEGRVTQPNINLGMAKARHYVIGYDRMFGDNIHLRAEAYYQDLYNVPVLNDSTFSESSLNSTAGFTTADLVNRGTGKNYGVELTLEKFFSDNWYFLVTTSLYESKYASIDGKEYNTRYNGNFVNNFLIGKEFLLGKSKQNRFSVSLRSVWSGGKRFTPIDLEASKDAGFTIRQWDRRFEERTPAYLRPDLSLNYIWNRKKVTHTIRFDIQNVISRTNSFGSYYDRRTDQIESDERGGMIPVLSYKVNF
ncbi:MAG: TonB-dependent receptor [Bacteroidia bacterium]